MVSGNTSVLATILFLGVVVIGGLLAVYHFLVFPNIDGVAQDVAWYNYDKESTHFLYWFFFWNIVIGSGAGLGLIANKNRG